MDAFIQALPNLSVGVVSVLALVYIVLKFLEKLDQREAAMRALEKDVRENIAGHLTQSSIALQQNTKVLERVILQLDQK